MYGLELIDVGWADEIVIVYVARRPKVCGDVYTVYFNNIGFCYISKVGATHDEQDREAIKHFTDLLNDEQRARRVFHIE